MKKAYITLSLLSFFMFSSSYGQVSAQGVSGGGVLTFYKKNADKKASTVGSEYIVEDFASARVNGGTQTFQIRFNAFNNVMEYKKDNDNLILIKNDNTLIEFTNGPVYELVSYTDKKGKENKDYLSVINNSGNVAIYKLEKINFIEARSAVNTYDLGSPAEYKRASDSYFIKVNGVVSELPTKAKGFISLFPSKEAEIKEYFKQNKINFKDNDDLEKLTIFLNKLA